MPGTIRVSVLEVVDLPEVVTGARDGTIGKNVTAKVTLGPRLFKTKPGVADGGRILSWNSDFSFPVMNLRDKLVVSICDSEDHSVTQTAIEVPSIIQKGSRDEFIALNKGGRIHLKMNFILSDEEKKKIEIMRTAALKRKEEAEHRKKTVIVQPVTPEKELKKSPAVSTIAITEVDTSNTGDKKDTKEPANGSLGDRKDSTVLGDNMDSTISGDKTDSTLTVDEKDTTTLGDKTSTLKRPAPKPMFNYAKAIGMPSRAKTAKKPHAAVSDSSANEANTHNDDASSGLQTVRESAKDAEEAASSDTTKLDASIKASITGGRESNNVNNEAKAKANSGDVNSEVQTGGENAENAEELGNIKVDGATPLEAKPADGVDSIVQSIPVPTEGDPGVFWTNEVGEADKSGMDSEAQGVGERTGTSQEVNSSELDASAVDALPINGHESATLIMASTDSTASRDSLSIRSSSWGPASTLQRVKRTLSRVSSRRNSNRGSSSNPVSRTPPPVPVVWIQESVKRAISNVKGCYGLNPSTVNH